MDSSVIQIEKSANEPSPERCADFSINHTSELGSPSLVICARGKPDDLSTVLVLPGGDP